MELNSIEKNNRLSAPNNGIIYKTSAIEKLAYEAILLKDRERGYFQWSSFAASKTNTFWHLCTYLSLQQPYHVTSIYQG